MSQLKWALAETAVAIANGLSVKDDDWFSATNEVLCIVCTASAVCHLANWYLERPTR